MPKSLWEKLSDSWGLSRRALFQQGGMLAAAQALGVTVEQSASAAPMQLGNIYRSIGVRPVINARGTFTIITGSTTLPEVKRAMEEASHSFVNMDELMDGVGNRLAELSGAEWGIVTAGCCAAVTHCTASAIAGGNPERMQRLPNLAGLKNEVIVPAYSHNVYDHAVRMLGVKLLVVHDKAELEPAFNERTAMVYILAGPGDDGPLGTQAIAEVARRKNVPVVVDAAAEILTLKPNVHLQRGASAVAYSGGKCIRGPQAAGLLFGEKSLLQGAWVNSAPHHAFGRSVKVGKEEIMGMLAAVRQWYKRDHAAEWKQWQSWLDTIADRVKGLPSVTTEILQPEDLSNHSPQLRVHWDANVLKITGVELEAKLDAGTPRILIGQAKGKRPDDMASAVTIMPYMMAPGEAEMVADAIYLGLTKPGNYQNPVVPQGETAQLGGTWTVLIDYLCGTGMQRFELMQNNQEINGTLYGEIYKAALSGKVQANEISLKGTMPTSGYEVRWTFQGTSTGEQMAGMADMGEYGSVPWKAFRVQKQ
jgi:uncharacterized pyridoxal phosphate-dependent enzyme